VYTTTRDHHPGYQCEWPTKPVSGGTCSPRSNSAVPGDHHGLGPYAYSPPLSSLRRQLLSVVGVTGIIRMCRAEKLARSDNDVEDILQLFKGKSLMRISPPFLIFGSWSLRDAFPSVPTIVDAGARAARPSNRHLEVGDTRGRAARGAEYPGGGRLPPGPNTRYQGHSCPGWVGERPGVEANLPGSCKEVSHLIGPAQL
jgi:hypothetical protein